MRFIITFVLGFLFTASALAADCEKALFGWTARGGHHISGVFGNEGGFQNLKSDRGNFSAETGKNCGGTNYGLSCRSYPAINVRLLTKEKAAEIYHSDQWAAVKGDNIKSQYIAYKLFDLGINMGTGSAIILMEQTINELNDSQKDFPLIGHITQAHVDWINSYTPDRTQRHLFIATLKLKAMHRYLSIVQKNPKMKNFLVTWGVRDLDDE